MAAAEARHSAYYAGLIQRSINPQMGRATPDARSELNRNLDNLRAAWVRAAVRGDTAALAAMSRGLWILHDERGWLHDGAALFGAAAGSVGPVAFLPNGDAVLGWTPNGDELVCR